MARQVLNVQKYPDMRSIARRAAAAPVRCRRVDVADPDGRACRSSHDADLRRSAGTAETAWT